MLKDYFDKKNISIYALSKETGIPYSTLNDMANGIISVDGISCRNLKKIADALCITMDEAYCICQFDVSVSTKINNIIVRGHVLIKNKKCYVLGIYKGISFEEYLCKANKINMKFIDDIAITGLINITTRIDFNDC